ncbi:MAG: DUF6275 family protein [Clostridium sp.]|nr:MAG: DUF6275 family protein [Clostridium sp.]
MLQNNKALLSTPILDGMYFECTYNGDKKELYIDAYSKEQNIVYRWREYEEKKYLEKEINKKSIRTRKKLRIRKKE